MIHRCRDYALQRSQSVISRDAVTDPVVHAARIGSGGVTFPKPVDLGKHRNSGFVWIFKTSVWFGAVPQPDGVIGTRFSFYLC
jgi:hypothetical protein